MTTMLDTQVDKITTVAGTGVAGRQGDGGQATSAQLSWPVGVTVHPGTGEIYIADYANHLVRKIDTAGNISTIAGTGAAGFNDHGQAVEAALNHPTGVAVNSAGEVYIVEWHGQRVRKMSTDGSITTVAGQVNQAGHAGDGGAATSATLNYPFGVGLSNAGELYIADWGSHCIRKVDADGVITTVTGRAGHWGHEGDGNEGTTSPTTTSPKTGRP